MAKKSSKDTTNTQVQMVEKSTPKQKQDSGLLLPGIIAALAGIFLWIGVIGFWLSGTVFNQEFFVGSLTTAMKSTEARQMIATTVVNKVLADYPIIKSLVGNRADKAIFDLLDSTQLEFVYQKAAEEVFYQMTDPNPGEVALDFSRFTRFVPLVERLNPQIGDKLANIPDKVVIIQKNEIPSMYAYKQTADTFSPISLVLAVVLFIGALFLAKGLSSKVFVVGILGLTLALVSGVLSYAIPSTEVSVLGQIQDQLVLTIASQVIRVFTDNLMTLVSKVLWLGLIVGAAGLVGGFILRKR